MNTNIHAPSAYANRFATHVRPDPIELKFRANVQRPAHRLPFIGRVPGRPDASFWNVPQIGDYSGNNETGAALAMLYMKHLRNDDTLETGLLQRIVLDMLGEGASNDAATSALRGQIVGFFTQIEPWLIWAARQGGAGLDRHDENDLLDRANRGLNFDFDAWASTQPADEEV